MFNFATVIVLATAVSALPSLNAGKRTAATVLANLKTIDADAVTLTTGATNWDGSLIGALGLYGELTTLESAITSATTEAKTESQASEADSQTLLDYVNGPITTDIQSALDVLVDRQDDVEAAGLTTTVVGIIKTLQTDIDALSAALIALSATDLQADAEAFAAYIDSVFATAIALFN